MGIIYSKTKSIWRRVIPQEANAYVFSGRTAFSRSVLKLKSKLEESASHDELYDESYFRRQDAAMQQPAAVIADSILTQFSPESVLDVGCGSGDVMAALHSEGIKAVGLEYSKAAINICREKKLDVRSFDLEGEQAPDVGRFDLVLSTEVAEHLPAACADRYVHLLVSHAISQVVMIFELDDSSNATPCYAS